MIIPEVIINENRPIIRPDRFLVSELFFSVQGEGISLGRPAIFVRLHMCCLTCEWCDTRYTWDPNDPDYYNYETLTLDELLARISAFPCRRLVLSGGEPLLHVAAIDKLLGLLGPEWEIEIETNGTLVGSPLIRQRCQLNISPKLPSAHNRARTIKPATLAQLLDSRDPWFKFVVADQHDFDVMVQVIEECHLPAERIIVMPEGEDIETIITHARQIIEQVKAHNYRLLPRLQVLIYGDQRGV
jgi:7-carboxy-7-deazaguanine synthase